MPSEETPGRGNGRNGITLYIYEYAEETTCVEPGRVVVPRGSEVSWENLTEDEVLLHFPEPEIFDPPTSSMSLSQTGDRKTLKVASGAIRGGHQYGGVRLKQGRLPELLVGASIPMMIIR